MTIEAALAECSGQAWKAHCSCGTLVRAVVHAAVHGWSSRRSRLRKRRARAAARTGVPIPESFEAYVGPIENGLPWPTRRDGLAGVALFVLDTLRLLPSARAAALAESLLAAKSAWP